MKGTEGGLFLWSIPTGSTPLFFGIQMKCQIRFVILFPRAPLESVTLPRTFLMLGIDTIEVALVFAGDLHISSS